MNQARRAAITGAAGTEKIQRSVGPMGRKLSLIRSHKYTRSTNQVLGDKAAKMKR